MDNVTQLELVSNVVVLPVVTSLDVDVNRVLQGAIDNKPKVAIVIGENEDGSLYFATSVSDGGTVLWWMEKAKLALMNCSL